MNLKNEKLATWYLSNGRRIENWCADCTDMESVKVCWKQGENGDRYDHHFHDKLTGKSYYFYDEVSFNLNSINMEQLFPKRITTLVKGASYGVPRFEVTNDGLKQADEGFTIDFCKGNREDENIPRQTGFFTETLIKVAKQYLEDVNVGPLASRETSTAITKLDEALMWIAKRAEDRTEREVQGTYKP